MYQIVQLFQLTLFPLAYFDLVIADGSLAIFWTENWYRLTWNLAHMLSNWKALIEINFNWNLVFTYFC